MPALALAASVGRLHIVAIAALGTFTFGWAFTGRYPFDLAAICALDWFIVNLLNRVVDLEEDRANGIRGVEFAARHRRGILVLGFGLLATSVALVHLALPEITPLRLGYHLLGLGYNWRIPGAGWRIKELYFWKNTASAIGFMLTVFGYPLATSGWGQEVLPDVGWATVAFAAGFFFLFELSYEVIYDLRDAPGDAAAGVRTYPVVHGEAEAVRIIDALLLLSATVLTAGWLLGDVPWRIYVMIAAPAMQLALYKPALRRGITSAFCVGITWLGAGLLATYHLWQLAGLPGSEPLP